MQIGDDAHPLPPRHPSPGVGLGRAVLDRARRRAAILSRIIDHQLAAADYRSKACAASAIASATPLSQVRERQEAAARAWLELAAFEDRRIAHSVEIAAKVAARQAAT